MQTQEVPGRTRTQHAPHYSLGPRNNTRNLRNFSGLALPQWRNAPTAYRAEGPNGAAKGASASCQTPFRESSLSDILTCLANEVAFNSVSATIANVSANDPVASLGDVLREYRRQADLTQEALAERAGISPRSISEMERGGAHVPRRDTVAMLVRALNLTGADRETFEAAINRTRRQRQRSITHRASSAPIGNATLRSEDDLGLSWSADARIQHPGSYWRPQPGLHNLPVELTSFVGRESELQAISAQLARARCVSLIGTGGCGKTRLASQVGHRVQQSYGSGVWFVEFGEIADPKLVPHVVAHALGLEETNASDGPVSRLVELLRAEHLLLILDNCEHLLAASAALVDTLVRGCANLHVLATSRQALGVIGEITIRVPSLELPPQAERADRDRVAASESVRLFVERARERQPAFVISDDNAAAIAEICWRVGGIPLALELAAAWMRVLSPRQLAERLKDQFQLLTSTSISVPRRHQTLRTLVDWSYDLLTEPERVLFRRLAVFAGGWPLEAAEFLCAPDVTTSAPAASASVLEVTAGLVDKSVVQAEYSNGNGATRFRLLEPVREYARERLHLSGEAAVIRDRHRSWLIALATQAEDSWRGEGGAAWLARFDLELDNVRAALAWSKRAFNTPDGVPSPDEPEVLAALRLVSALWWFWLLRGQLTEGREHLAALLQIADNLGLVALPERARALQASGRLAQVQGDLKEAASLLEASLALGPVAGPDTIQRADVLHDLGLIAHVEGNLERADALQSEALVLARQQDDNVRMYRSLYHLGEVAADRGQHQRAQQLLEDALRRARDAGDRRGIAIAAADLGRVLHQTGPTQRTARLYVESVRLLADLGDRRRLASSLLGLARVALDCGEVEHAAEWGGMAESLASAAAGKPPPGWSVARDELHDALHAAGNAQAAEAAWAGGRALDADEAMVSARSADLRPVSGVRGQAANIDRHSVLSAREQEVATLLATGYSNPEIAERLVVARRTADSHVQNILTKLGFHNRAQVAAWFVERQHAKV